MIKSPKRRILRGNRSRSIAKAVTLTLALSLAVPTFATLDYAQAAGEPAYKNTSLSFSLRAADLVSRMTLTEKVDQLRAQYESGRYAPPISRLGVPGYAYWSEGLHGVARAEFVNSATADYYNSTAGRTKENEFGERFSPLSDTWTPANQGYATSFSYGLGQASSWNRDLVRRATSITSDEARAYNNFRKKGLTYWSPTMNLDRDPRWGRSEEAFGEDAYLAGEIAGAFVQGMQGNNPTYLKAVATPKHFYAQSSETDRHVGKGANLTEREQREYYTYHFAKAMGEYGAGAAMSAYNAINGVPAVIDRDTLLTQARRVWGFTGYVSSDCSGIGDINFGHYFVQGFGTHDMATDEQKAVAAAIKGGTDLDCTSNGEVGSRSAPYIRWMSSQGLEAKERSTSAGAYELGYVTEADIDIALQRAFEIRFRLGEFDPEERNPWPANEYNVLNPDTRATPEALAVAQQTSDEAVVMLENRKVAGANVLPLVAPEKIAVIGSYSQYAVNARKYDPKSRIAATSPIAAITARAQKARDDAGLSAPEVRYMVGRENTVTSGNLTTDKPALGGSAMLYPANPTAPYPYPASYADGGGNYGTIAQFKDSSDTIVSNMPVRAIKNMQGWTFPASYGRTWTTLGSGNTWLGQFELVWDVPANATSVDLRFATGGDRAGRWDVYLGKDKTGTLLKSSSAYNTTTLNVPLPSGVAGTRATFFVDYNTTNPNTGKNYYQASFSAEEEEFIRNADVVIVYAGQGQSESGNSPAGADNPREGNDRGTIQLPKGQDEMIARAAELNPKTIAYIQGNDLVDVTKFKNKVAGLFWTTFNGQFQSEAATRLLWGDVNPSAKTVTTWYATNEDLGWITDYQMTPDADHNGRTYMYFDGGESGVSYPFGYGLSYSNFSYSNLRLSNSSVRPGEIVNVSIDVTNTSNIAGQEVVQVYATSPSSNGIDRPRSQLRGFDKVRIEANQTKTVTIPLKTSEMWFWDPVNDREVFDQGQWKLWVGGQSVDGLSAPPSGLGLSTTLTLNGTLKPEVDKVVAIPDGIVLNTAAPDNVIHANLSATRPDQSFYDLATVKVEYTSSDPSIAQVDKTGTVRPVGPGAAVITARVTADESTKSTTFPVIVHGTGGNNPVPEGHRQGLVNFPSLTLTLSQAEAGVQATAEAIPGEGGTQYRYSLSYYTENTANATVSPTGLITATEVGTARVNVLATIPIESGEPVLVSKDAVITVIPDAAAVDPTALQQRITQLENLLVATNYTADSWAALQEAIATGKDALTATEQSTIDDALAALNTAVDSLVPRGQVSMLSAAIAVYQGLAGAAGIYTSVSWNALVNAVGDAQVYIANPVNVTQSQVDAALSAINAAIAGLQVAVDKKLLATLINNVERQISNGALIQVNFSEVSWNNLQLALNNARAQNSSATATQASVDSAASVLQSALANLEARYNVQQLQSLLNSVTALGLVSSDYIPASWAIYQMALNTARSQVATPSSQTAIDAASTALSNAISGLQIDPNRTAPASLTALVAASEQRNPASYTATSWARVVSGIAAAKQTLATGTNAEAAQALTILQNALDQLVTRPSTAGLASVVATAQAIDTTLYTTASVSNLTEELARAQNLLSSDIDSLSQSGINAAITAINTAVSALVLTPVDPNRTSPAALTVLVAASEQRNPASYTATSWARVTSALAQAKQALATGTNAEAAQALTTLQNALDQLVARPATAGLASVVTAAQAIDTTPYTAASASTLRTALATAQNLLAKDVDSLSQAEIDAVIAAINAAIGSLAPAMQASDQPGIKPPVTNPGVKVTTKSVTVKGAAFKKNSKPKVSVSVKLSAGTAKGKVTVYVGSKAVKTVNVSKAVTSITLPVKYKKAITVKAQYKPAKVNVNGTQKLSAAVKVKIK